MMGPQERVGELADADLSAYKAISRDRVSVGEHRNLYLV